MMEMQIAWNRVSENSALAELIFKRYLKRKSMRGKVRQTLEEFVEGGGSVEYFVDELSSVLDDCDDVVFSEYWTDGDYEGDFYVKEIAGMFFAFDSGACVLSGPYLDAGELFERCYGRQVLWEQDPDRSEYTIFSSLGDKIFLRLFADCRCKITYNGTPYTWTTSGLRPSA